MNINHCSITEAALLSEMMLLSGAVDGYFPHEYLFSTGEDVLSYRLSLMRHCFTSEKGYCFSLQEGGLFLGLAGLSRLDWDSNYYGHEIYTLHIFFRSKVSIDSRKEFIASVIGRCRQSVPIRQVFITLSSAEEHSTQALEFLGFKEQGCSLTLYASKAMKPYAHLRSERAGMVLDGGDVPEDSIVELACCIQFPSRMYKDKLYCPDLVRKMHAHWLRQTLSRPLSDRSVKTFVRDRQVVGLAASEKILLPLGEHKDVRVFGRTLFGFISGQGVHALDSLLRAGLQDALNKCDVIESTVAVGNNVTIRMLNRASHKIARFNRSMTLTLPECAC